MSIALHQSEAAPSTARRIVLRGRVQGIGLRPAVARWAAECHLAGSVANDGQGVEIVVEGAERAVARFADGLAERLPQEACVSGREISELPVADRPPFRIAGSSPAAVPATPVPQDTAVCQTCVDEVANPADRRLAYPFTCCATCGPRFSLVERMPYERSSTAMAAFPLCAECRREYEDPADRRFHAQTVACRTCGPRVHLADRDGRVLAADDPAIELAARALREGAIVAVRGVGGYQLLVDAASPAAVDRLRISKQRPAKPLAVMVESLAVASRLAHLDEAERRELAAPANPIVVVRRRGDARLAAAVCGGLDTVGVLLATTPLHALLLRRAGRALVATSGNRDGEPLAYEPAAAERQLAGVAELFLHHDRPIRHPVDDSVVRVMAGRAVTLRLGRGLAPLPLELPCPAGLAAVGGHQKAAFALANGGQAVLAPHVGDLDDLITRARFVERWESLAALYGAAPRRVACDAHPDYFTTTWAHERFPRPVAVQHHHAHVLAGMLEHGWLDREVLGLAWDGSGYGSDGTLWGGEVLRVSAGGFRRLGHLRPLPLAGGERAIRGPWRVAFALVREALGPRAAAALRFPGVPSTAVNRVESLCGNPRLALPTTSVGRLFDGVASLVLGMADAAYEGQAAMLLEAHSDPAIPGQYPLPLIGEAPFEIDWRPMIAALLAERARAVDPTVMATRFVRGLAQAAVEAATRPPLRPVVLGGGVFQNRFLVEEIVALWPNDGPPLGLPGRIPPNDGGLAAGQLAALAQACANQSGGSAACV